MKSNKHNTGPVLAVVTAAALLGAAALAPKSTEHVESQEQLSRIATAQIDANVMEKAIQEGATIPHKPVLPGIVKFRNNVGDEIGTAYSPIVFSPGKGALKVTTNNVDSALNGAILGLQTKDSNGKMHIMVAEFNEVFTSFIPMDKNRLKPVRTDIKSTKIGDSVNPQYILTPVEGTYPSDITFPSGTVGQYIEAPGQETAGKTLSF